MDQSVSQSQRIANDIQQMARGITDALVKQNITMKEIHRKVMDLVNTFETSRSVMLMIEKRQYTDAMIVYGGMVVVCLVLALVWWFK